MPERVLCVNDVNSEIIELLFYCLNVIFAIHDEFLFVKLELMFENTDSIHENSWT